jgi:hypothetical protein
VSDKKKLSEAIKLVKTAKKNIEKAEELAGGIEGATDGTGSALSECDSAIHEMEEILEDLD